METKQDEDLQIHVGKNQIKQALINIIMNAIESMEKKLKEQPELAGHLTLRVSTAAEGDRVLITISDEGCGMNEKELRRCTDPFFTTKTKGTGLGLAVSKSYIEENGGILFIDSREREYTRITLEFPRYIAEVQES